MSQYYLPQNYVHVFPFGNTRPTDPFARVLNEQNIAALCRRVSPKSSYVLDWDETNGIVEFMIYGYYFKTNIATIIGNFREKDLFAKITLDTINGYEYLNGGDTNVVLTQDSDNNYLLKEDGTVNQRIKETTTYIYKSDTPLTCIRIFNNSSFTLNVSENLVSTMSQDSSYYDVTPNPKGGEGEFVLTITKNVDVNEAIVGMIVNKSSDFTGVSFVTETANDGSKYLHLLDKDGQIPVSSRLNQRQKLTSFTAVQTYLADYQEFSIDQVLPQLDAGKSFWIIPAATYFKTDYTSEPNTKMKVTFSYEDSENEGVIHQKTLEGTLTLMDGLPLVNLSFKEDTINTVYFKIDKDATTVKAFLNSAVSIWAE